MASRMLPITRSKYSRTPQTKPEDYVKLDLDRDPFENAKEILTELTRKSEISETKRLNYLNAFVKLVLHLKKNVALLGFSVENILICLRICVVDEAAQVRSGGFRAVRHVLNTEEDVLCFNRLLFPFLIARSFDLLLVDCERAESLKLIRKVMYLSPSTFTTPVSISLVSFAKGSIEEKDRMLRACLATLSELCVLNPDVFIASGGVAAITRNLLECQTPKIAESLCGVLVLLLDKPSTRNIAAIDLHCVCAPYCDFHYRHGWMDKNRDERELKFNCSRLALLSLLRSWPGIIHLCNPNDSKGFKAIVDVLYLNQLEVRKAVLDLLYELLGLPQPEWSDELSVALTAVDPAEPQASWRLNEGFVVAEGRSVLPHLARTTPSITDMHLSLILYCFLETGLLGALVEVIVTSDTFISVRATVLLGELLRLIQVMLPPECCNITPALPNLLKYAVSNKPHALPAITALQQCHKLLKHRPASQSLYLDFILQSGSYMKTSNKIEYSSRKYKKGILRSKITQLFKADDFIKESGVLVNKDPYSWDWNLVKVLLKDDKLFKIDLNENTHKSFLKRLVDFFKPSNHLYSHTELTNEKRIYTLVGIELVYCLLKSSDDYATKLLNELFEDISNNISAISTSKSSHDCLFSPQHMGNTMCQTYFLFIGRLGTRTAGIKILQNLKIFDQLSQLAITTNHACYVKLIVSSLDYKEQSPARRLLSSVLKSRQESSRLYATQFLQILLRADVPEFSKWGIELIAKQLKDESRTIRLAALSILHEAAEVPACLDSLVNVNPALLESLGEKGLFLLIRFLSTVSGFHLLESNGFVQKEMDRWNQTMLYRYVKIVETEMSDALTLHQRGEDGRYDKRTSSSRSTSKKDVFLPPHLYGQLTSHKEGFDLLLQQAPIDILIEHLEMSYSEKDDDILKVKAAIWALCQIGSSKVGVKLLHSKNVIVLIVQLAEKSEIYSIRATAFYALGLVASTKFGADCLFKLGWVSTRHDRHDRYPVIEEENWDEDSSQIPIKISSTGSDSEPSSERDQMFAYIEEPTSDLNTTDSDDILFMGNSEPSADQKKSQTLPNNQSATYPHTRSMSESKTYEGLGSLPLRMSNSVTNKDGSGTESTSGPESSEWSSGYPPKRQDNYYHSFFGERTQTLSPIPSSSSLSTLRRDRRYSESSKQHSILSITPSDHSTVSPPSSTSGRLSRDDIRGYRYLKKIQENDYNSGIWHTGRSRFTTMRSDWSGSSFTPSDYEDYMESMQWFRNMEDVQLPKMDVRENNNRGQCYMGICLPMELTNLFPDGRSSELMFRNGRTPQQGNIVRNGVLLRHRADTSIHDPTTCFRCSQIRNRLSKISLVPQKHEDIPSTSTSTMDHNSTQDEIIKADIILQVERLANPLFMKSAKQSLVQHKQKSPEIFQDMCLYSDVCRVISENTYRLGPRRMIQELFMDVVFDFTSCNIDEILSKERDLSVAADKNDGLVTVSNSNVVRGFEVKPTDDTQPTQRISLHEGVIKVPQLCNHSTNKTETVVPVAIKTLDKLKFTYNENKFPIKNRDENSVIK